MVGDAKLLALNYAGIPVVVRFAQNDRVQPAFGSSSLQGVQHKATLPA